MAILAVVLGGAFYLLLIDTTSLPELYVLIGVALACAVGFQLARQQDFVEARVVPRWLLGAWRLLVNIPRDIVIVCSEALSQLVAPRKVRGTFRATRFDAVADTPDATGRRAVTEAIGSLAPNTIVVGIDPDRHLLLVHQLKRHGSPESLDPVKLG